MLQGFRLVKVLENVQSGELDRSGSYTYLEVSNLTGATVYFRPNRDVQQGHVPPAQSIPIPANSTRVIPMIVYNFTATGDVTVVAYGR